MKISTKILSGSLLVTLWVAGSGQVAQAGEPGPSAKMAARLKKYPTSQWLAHYLPDDRYKIAGGVWKYVSTDLDTYYHRPNSPLMLRQSAGRVIGFASAAEAEEAGYKPAPGVDSGSFSMGGQSSGSRVTEAPLTSAEIKYLRSLDTFIDGLSQSPFRRTGQQTRSAGSWVTGFFRSVKVLAAVPIPSRFAEPGKKIRSGLNTLTEVTNELNGGRVQPNDPRISSSYVEWLQGVIQLARTVGVKNFNRYVTIPGVAGRAGL
ncbi:hypothetical protein EON80_10415 [bacterium]|nr:MAG: hypothetical protein EON80_10415 [bacterium]